MPVSIGQFYWIDGRFSSKAWWVAGTVSTWPVNFVVFSPWLRRLTSAWSIHRRCRPGPFFGRTASSAPWGLAYRCWTSTAGGSIAEPKRDDLVTSPLILTISNPYLFFAIETDYSSPWITKNRVLTLWFSPLRIINQSNVVSHFFREKVDHGQR